MKTREQKIGDVIYRFYYDNSIRLWTVYEIDSNGEQIAVAEYYHNKEQLKNDIKGIKL